MTDRTPKGPFKLVVGDELLGAYIAVPAAGRGPGVLVIHAERGLTPFFGALCERLAAKGFVAMAPDYHGGEPLAIGMLGWGVRPRREPSDTPPDDGRASQLLAAAARHLGAHPLVNRPGIATLGVARGCRFAMALAEAMPEQIAASVLFYGLQPGRYRHARAAFLGHFGKADRMIPPKSIRAVESTLKTAGCDVSFEVYDHVSHAFFETDRPEHFDPATALLAWQRTVRFLRERLGGEAKV